MHQSQKCTYIINLDRLEPGRSPKQDEAALCLLNQLLEEDAPAQLALEEFQAFGQTYPAGTFLIQAPFRGRLGVPWDVVMSWLEVNGRQKDACCIEKTSEQIKVNSKTLIVPRIALFYDATTYDNSLMHYLTFRSMGFRVTLTNARDLLKDESDPDSVLASSNVFVMPGGSMHFSSFSTPEDAARAIENLRGFVRNGGGYIGVCAGATDERDVYQNHLVSPTRTPVQCNEHPAPHP